MPPFIVEDETHQLIKWVHDVNENAESEFEAAREIVKRLGAHDRHGYTEVGFWVPEQIEVGIEDFYLEILTPPDDLDLIQPEQQLDFSVTRVPLVLDGEYVWGVVANMNPGKKNRVGDFYWLAYQLDDEWLHVPDPLAYSVPFGVKAPAEYYDMEGMFAARADAEYFRTQLHFDPDQETDGIPRIAAPVNMLEVHVGTASEEGTIAGLTRIYWTIADKLHNNEPLTAAEENYVGYDTIQLMPIEPPIEHEAGPYFWELLSDNGDTVTVQVRQHDIFDWGYDVMVAASPATNPALLGTKRPHELLELIETLHHFPGKPIKFMFDIVYGHTDNQAIGIMDKNFLAGQNMYGQNLDYLNPTVRAILLEMQRRKHNYGVDGIRVDGAQDFKWWDPETEQMVHDDAYLHLMNDVTLEVAGVTYRPWMIFEDGRPWPREDWELASSYREVTKIMPNVWQWGPLTFAHNTPFLFTFWISKWWRIREMAEVGSHWITGCANHDTLRRGSQVSPEARVNTYLGTALPEIFKNGYDNAAAKLFDYAMMPGVPMDFLNANMRGPWGFMRNTDEKFGVKVMSEEVNFVHWCMTPELYYQGVHFQRIKAHGFTAFTEIARYITHLDRAVQATHYDLPNIVRILNSLNPTLAAHPFTVDKLKAIALDWMSDVHDYCNVAHFEGTQNATKTSYNLALREFRRERRWLMNNLRADEFLKVQRPVDGSVIFYGKRIGYDESLLFIANMEGAPRSLNPAQLFDLEDDNWDVAIATPGLDVESVSSLLELQDSEGVVFIRRS